MLTQSKELAVGQVWADQRFVGREVQIVGLDATYVYVQTVQLAPGSWQRALGRHLRIKRSRFKPGPQGFSYVRG